MGRKSKKCSRAIAKAEKAKAPLTTMNGDALLGEGAGTLAAGGTGEAIADVGVGAAAADTFITLISTFCPAWQ